MRWLLIAAIVLSGLIPAWADPGSDFPSGPSERPRYIVGFKPGVGAARRAKLLKELGLSSKEDFELDSAFLSVVESDGWLFRTGASTLSDDTMTKLQGHPDILAVEKDEYWPNWLVDSPASMSQAYWPSMQEMRGLIHFAGVSGAPGDDAQKELPWGIERVNAPSVWVRGDGKTQGAGVRVAVIDTGIDCGHKDLNCDLSEGYNALDSKKLPKDDHGHGTHVAGTIAARWDGQGVVGVAPQARVIPVKVLDTKGGGSLSSIIRGIVWVASPKRKIDVANMSLGAPISSVFMHMAVMYAHAMGVTLVVAAGNSGPAQNTVSYPGAYRQVIAVAASDKDGRVASFSSRGPQVAFIAPGMDVRSTFPNGGYATHSGTSMATPHVTGLAALAIAQGIRGPEEVRAALKSAAAPLPRANYKPEEQGLGLIDAAKIVRSRR